MSDTKRLIIGFTGHKGSGKDTAAKALVDGLGYVNTKFAGGLKTMVGALLKYQGVYDVDIPKYIEGDLKEVPSPYLAGQTPRHAMITVGTEWGRDLMAEDFWIQVWLSKVKNIDENVVVTDVRFPNEANAIRSLGGRIIRIKGGKEVPNNEWSEHPSEKYIDTLPVDYEIQNRGTIYDLHQETYMVHKMAKDVWL